MKRQQREAARPKSAQSGKERDSQSGTPKKYGKRPGSASATRRAQNNLTVIRQRPKSASSKRPIEAEKQVQSIVPKIVKDLQRESRLVEALALELKLVEDTAKLDGFRSTNFKQHLKLSVSLLVDLARKVETEGDQSDALMTVDFAYNCISFVDQAKYSSEIEEISSSQLGEWNSVCQDLKVLLHSVAANLFRKIGKEQESENQIDMAVEFAAERKTNHARNKSLKATKYTVEADLWLARCYLIRCTTLSHSSAHDGAFTHAKAAASILGNMQSLFNSKTVIGCQIITSLGIAYYNAGAEAEHVFMKRNRSRPLSSTENPGMIWYKKACTLLTRFPSVFPRDLRFAFESTLCSLQRDAQLPKTTKKQRRPRRAHSQERRLPLPEVADQSLLETLVQRVKYSGTNIQVFLEELGRSARPNQQGHWHILRDQFVETISEFVTKAEAQSISRYFALQDGASGVDWAKVEHYFQIICPSDRDVRTTPRPPHQLIIERISSCKAEFSRALMSACNYNIDLSETMTAADLLGILKTLNIVVAAKVARELEDGIAVYYGGSVPVEELCSSLNLNPNAYILEGNPDFEDDIDCFGNDFYSYSFDEGEGEDEDDFHPCLLQDENNCSSTNSGMVDPPKVFVQHKASLPPLVPKLKRANQMAMATSGDYTRESEDKEEEEEEKENILEEFSLVPELEDAGVNEEDTVLLGENFVCDSDVDADDCYNENEDMILTNNQREPGHEFWTQNELLDTLEQIDLKGMYEKFKIASQRLKTTKQRNNSKSLIESNQKGLNKPISTTKRDHDKISREDISCAPVPVLVAGWRLFLGESGSGESTVSDDGKLMKWPPMVRQAELNIFLEGPSQKYTQNHHGQREGQRSDSNFKQDTIENRTDTHISWGAQLRALRERARLISEMNF